MQHGVGINITSLLKPLTTSVSCTFGFNLQLFNYVSTSTTSEKMSESNHKTDSTENYTNNSSSHRKTSAAAMSIEMTPRTKTKYNAKQTQLNAKYQPLPIVDFSKVFSANKDEVFGILCGDIVAVVQLVCDRMVQKVTFNKSLEEVHKDMKKIEDLLEKRIELLEKAYSGLQDQLEEPKNLKRRELSSNRSNALRCLEKKKRDCNICEDSVKYCVLHN